MDSNMQRKLRFPHKSTTKFMQKPIAIAMQQTNSSKSKQLIFTLSNSKQKVRSGSSVDDYGVDKMGEHLIQVAPNLTHLRFCYNKYPIKNQQYFRVLYCVSNYHTLIIKHPLVSNLIDDRYSRFCKLINAHLKQLQQIEIVSEGDPANDRSPNWTFELNITPKINKMITKATVKEREGADIPTHMLNNFEMTYPQKQYAVEIDIYQLDIFEEFPKIQSWKCPSLIFNNNIDYNNYEEKMPDMKLLLFIKDIRFTDLRHLELNGNGIYSTETFSWIDAPFLNHLQLRQNSICSVQSLRKMCSRELIFLDLVNNSINEESVWEGDWPQFNDMKIEQGPVSEGVGHVFSLVSLAKLTFNQKSEMNTMYVQAKKRIQEYKKFNSLRSKLIQGVLFTHDTYYD